MTKSPFLIIKDFISPLDCETIVSAVSQHFPDVDGEDADLKTILTNPLYEKRIWGRLEEYFEYIEDYYTVEIDSLSKMDLEWYPEQCVQEPLHCENSMYINKQWKIINDKDFTVIVFLKDYNNSKDFDNDFEVYGGKLEFVNHQFGFNPVRGTAIIFPSNHYFLNRTVSPMFGDLFQAKFHISCSTRFKYNPNNFAGNYKTWFGDLI